MAASRALPKVFTGGRSTSVRCVAELESPRSRAGYGVGLTECSPANRALEGMEKRCTRNSLSLSILPKTTDLACGATGQPSLLVHSHTEPCVCVWCCSHISRDGAGWGLQHPCTGSTAPTLLVCLWRENSILQTTVQASILLASCQEMTTLDLFGAKPPLIKSSKPSGKPRIPEAGLHPRVSSKQRCTLHVCLKWKHELVLTSTASKAAASGSSLEPKCWSQPTALSAGWDQRWAPGPRPPVREHLRSSSQMGRAANRGSRSTTSAWGRKRAAVRKHLGKSDFLSGSGKMFLSSSFCPCPSAALCDFPFHFQLSVLSAKGNEKGLFYTQVVYPLRKGAPCCAS